MTYKPEIQVVFFPEKSVSPGGKAAFAIKHDGLILQNCIGSGETFRDAKACALRNTKNVLRQIKRMTENGK